jgi:Asp-tRNA(Asn)/Glu-tRNA(Gln) amidotransferase A subunit family amidase
VKRVGLVEGEHHPVSLDEYLQLFVARQEAQAKTQGVFLEHKLDAIISPGAPHVAVPHDTYTEYAPRYDRWFAHLAN